MRHTDPKRKKNATAVVVIHGIGEQSPFKTLDAFTTNFVQSLGSSTLDHQFTSQTGAGGVKWQDNFVRIQRGENYPIDIHEFYWAYLTEEKITIPEVEAWVAQTLEATKKFYDDNAQLQRAYEDRKKTTRFPLANVLLYLRFAAIALPFVNIARFFLSPVLHLPLFTWLSKIVHAGLDKLGWIVIGYIGDVAIYTTTDQKSKYFKIRQQILNESQALVESLLNDTSYDRVIIAGHSLGSVIAYDTLNRININANLKEGAKIPIDKLGGLITFGSPLDKIAFFFREHTGPNEYVRRQILAHLHSFKAKPLSLVDDPFQLGNPIQPKLDSIPWVNYYADNDPVSGHLDFYCIDAKDNVLLSLPQSWGVAHTGYWTSREFYEDIVKRFF